MYPARPDTIYIGSVKPLPKSGFRKDLLPEIKLRFNRSRFDLGQITKSEDAVQVLKRILGRQIETQEFMTAIFLNRANHPVGFYRHTMGGTGGTILDVKMICGLATKLLASNVILCHNHPSGNTKPSEADITVTRKLREALKTMDITLLDHIIVTRDGQFSMSDQGILGIGYSRWPQTKRCPKTKRIVKRKFARRRPLRGPVRLGLGFDNALG